MLIVSARGLEGASAVEVVPCGREVTSLDVLDREVVVVLTLLCVRLGGRGVEPVALVTLDGGLSA